MSIWNICNLLNACTLTINVEPYLHHVDWRSQLACIVCTYMSDLANWRADFDRDRLTHLYVQNTCQSASSISMNGDAALERTLFAHILIEIGCCTRIYYCATLAHTFMRSRWNKAVSKRHWTDNFYLIIHISYYLIAFTIDLLVYLSLR